MEKLKHNQKTPRCRVFKHKFFGAGGENASQLRRIHKSKLFCLAPCYRTLINSLKRILMRVQSPNSKARKKVVSEDTTFFLGAGGENRTLITCLEGTYISHYTTPA